MNKSVLASYLCRGGALGVAAAMAALVGRQGVLASLEATGLLAGGYTLALLIFGSFPRLRRNDLALIVGAFFVALSLLRYLDGATQAAAPLLCGAAGAAAAWLPGRVNAFRRDERHARRRRDAPISDLGLHGGEALATAPRARRS